MHPGRAVVAPTPRDTLLRDGTARLYRFRRPARGPDLGGAPLLLVPSLIHRWYVLDLHRNASLVEACVGAGIDTWLLDWGVPEDEDRYLAWDDLVGRLERAVRRVRRITGATRVGLLGYSMGGTLAAVHAALHDDAAALVNVAGPIDFAKGGALRELVDPRWFDASAVARAGNVTAWQIRSAFETIRPTVHLAKWAMLLERADDPNFFERWAAVETWSHDYVPFPGGAYETWIGELWQRNTLIQGEHRVGGRRVNLGRITCPLLTVVAERDAICPPDAARALHDHAGARDGEVIVAPGGHVGLLIGHRAPRALFPRIVDWLEDRLAPEGDGRMEEACN